ncbi:survival motor neuron-like protein, putative [Plasmodium berghei]|uniref:Survival motor neuron-like protein, putative n=2 Tax=Plasmodium berghei TaxID=5821 RepID=A0A509AM28_PLABA|nr:survival motor neuron-like protein, putative [Plasmodium berghei ANKA]CXI75918.1 survival motor neuron-like protein, putative [Plasmodium berghei]SCM24872.1 survival motor neuron-like protein, putative [Plasmodium berghei]SCN27194.1 survival motor neuron-like protein, putative [Plasmodium berghei]SCO61752.1 survival motor neuron-like protein, putative [Plasmodium berghei]SCO63617.1 survival motor neuron-like protein, putative [Plasmodium berghei]|eukprot:XP_034422828.1 survival motor neuron-like protein, putative [Plasmodium berghei ANKA]
MDEFNESLEDLEEKINEYNKQLALVRDEIKKYEQIQNDQNEENEQIQNLKKLECDMIEVINLTRDLIKYKKKNESDDEIPNQIAEENEQPFSNENVMNESELLIGRTCSFMYENKIVYGSIENVVIQNNMEQLLVHIFETNEQVLVQKNYVQLNEILHTLSASENNQFQALYKKDGQWYDCMVSKSKGDSYLITYIGYNNSEYVKNDQIRIKKKKKIKEVITPAGYKIPENLIIKENDSLKTKLKKTKKRNALKKKQKNELINKEFANKAQQWKSVHEKAISKSKHLLVAHKKTENIEYTNNPTNISIRRKFDYKDNDD